MKLNAALEAVHDVIYNNKDALVNGIVHQGQPREIKNIFRSILTNWGPSYTITLNSPGARERFVQAANTDRGATQVIYPIEIHLVDIAIPQPTDPAQTPYEQMHYDFRLVTERLYTLIKDTTVWYTEGNDRFRLVPFSEIRVEDRTNWFDVGTDVYPTMYIIIHFELYGCS